VTLTDGVSSYCGDAPEHPSKTRAFFFAQEPSASWKRRGTKNHYK
jgi:hypothetical protein